MCGIAGIWMWGGAPVPFARLQAMTDAQAHRGPDGHGFAVWERDPRARAPITWSGPATATPALDVRTLRLGLGHNLLAIQDASADARQPMASDAGALWLSFNGEIYNFRQLRAELRASGVDFRTASDTEVLLAAWARRGPACIEQLRGMFAFALWNAATETLWVVRDRFGMKPVYYATVAGGAGFVVASELRGVHASGLVTRRWNDTAIRSFLASGVNKPDDSGTFFEGVRELPPGCVLRVRAGELTVQRYYDIPDVGAASADERALPDIREAFLDSVRHHLVSARQVGVCLSGGLDSSNVACAVAKVLGDDIRDFQAYTFGSPGSSDVELASQQAARLGVRHRLVDAPERLRLDDLVEMTIACEIPNHTWGPINQFLLLRQIRAESGPTVLLDGNGGDEVLSGYPFFVPGVVAFVRERHGAARADALAAAYAAHSPLPPDGLRVMQRMYSSRALWLRLFDGGATAAMDVTPEEVSGWSAVEYFVNDALDWRGMRRQQMTRRELPHFLRQEDRLGMWFSMEGRLPFLDHPLVELLSALDPQFLYQNGFAKYPLRVLFGEMDEAVRWSTSKTGYWQPYSALPGINALARRAVSAADALRSVVPHPNKLRGASPLTSWRFLQAAILSTGLGVSDAQHWVRELRGRRAATPRPKARPRSTL